MALTTPISERVHVALFGRTNAGKSTLMNLLVGHDVAIVSPEAGTTTDPVQKALELMVRRPPWSTHRRTLFPRTTLGDERMARAAKVLNKTDLAIIIFTDQGGDSEWGMVDECRVREIPTLLVLNKVDQLSDAEAVSRYIEERAKRRVLAISALRGEGVEELRAAIVEGYKRDERLITEGFCEAGDRVLLVMPQDKSAPKGRLIQPQVQTIRELLDRGCVPICCTPDRMAEALASMTTPPELIITDSQAFNEVYALKPQESTLTSFSILFARYKGDIKLFTEGVKALGKLTEQSRILIAEACTHTPQNEDIGRVKLPRILRKRFGEGLHIDIVGGSDYPEELTSYDLVIHCGACMFNRQHVLSRIERARKQGVAITNYGVILAALTGILDRVRTE